MSTTVSNGPNSANPDYKVAGKVIGGEEFQKIILYDGSGNEITSWTITPSGTQDVNLTQIGGAGFLQGRRTTNASISVTSAEAQGDGLVQGSDVFPTGIWNAGAGQWVAWDGLVQIAGTLPSGTNAIGRVGHDITGIQSGRKVVTTAGTRVTLVSSSIPCKKVDITAETDNTGVIVVGGSGVIASLSTREGNPLTAGQPYSFEIDDLQKIYIDSTVSGDGVTFVYFT